MSDPITYLQTALMANTEKALFSSEEIARHCLLVQVWKNWSTIVGEHIANMGKPLGTHKSTLLIAVEDSCSAQEMQYYKDTILIAINTYIAEQYFTEIRIQQHTGETPLTTNTTLTSSYIPYTPCVTTLPYNTTLLPHTSLVARAYKAYSTINTKKNKEDSATSNLSKNNRGKK